MSALKIIGIGCLVAGLVTLCLIFFLGAGLFKMVTGFFSKVELTTGPPSRPQSIPDGYAVEGDQVRFTRNSNLFGNWMPGRVPLEGADAKTFQKMEDGDYGKDARRVYHEAAFMPGADPATFKALGSGFAGDAAHMYYDGKVIEGSSPLDAASFRILSQAGSRARDKNHVYDGGFIVEGADPASYELIRDGLVARDKNDYYCVSFDNNPSRHSPMHVHMASFKLAIPMDPPIPGENPWDNLWERIWAADDHQYYVGSKGFTIADPATFKVLQFGYAIDSMHIYFVDQVLADADPATFQIVSPDHEQKYVNWSWSFARYGKDAAHVFYKGSILADADAPTFTVENERVFKDKNHRYQEGRVRTEP